MDRVYEIGYKSGFCGPISIRLPPNERRKDFYIIGEQYKETKYKIPLSQTIKLWAY